MIASLIDIALPMRPSVAGRVIGGESMAMDEGMRCPVPSEIASFAHVN